MLLWNCTGARTWPLRLEEGAGPQENTGRGTSLEYSFAVLDVGNIQNIVSRFHLWMDVVDNLCSFMMFLFFYTHHIAIRTLSDGK